MSEEILKALMQLFALIAKQDEGTSIDQRNYVEAFLKHQLSEETIPTYLVMFDEHSGFNINEIKPESTEGSEPPVKKRRRISMIDSVRTIGICEQINKTLVQKQKYIVLVRLYEMINAEKKFTEQRLELISTVGDVFKIEPEILKSIKNFIISEKPEDITDENFMVISRGNEAPCEHCKHIHSENLDGYFYILKIKGDDLYFLRYTGKDEVSLNGLSLTNNNIYLFSNGSTIKTQKGKPIFYSDVLSYFLTEENQLRLSFNVKELVYRFPNGALGLRNISFSEKHGRLAGIMGASGSGKTTLLNTLVGNLKLHSGEVLINGINVHKENEEIEGVFGYIPQDDLLVEELTVFQNLFFNAKLCFKDRSEQKLTEMVDQVLNNLGLLEIKQLKVGSPLNKMISGGQRKRLNIALELIREPSVLFVDEPTSGLSSRDSENVMDLLRELALKGKLIFVVIHQPSSDIYKMFDNILILDRGGYLIYNGNPVEAISYFKKQDRQVNSEIAECPSCGNVNPEVIFNIIEARVVDEYGNFTDERKVSPAKWRERYELYCENEFIPDFDEAPPKSINIPEKLKQFQIFSTRDFLSKISNKQYIIINLLEAPVLAFFLSFITRYVNEKNSDYVFRDNDNIPAYIFMCIIVSLFIGLTVSAEEIYRDKRLLKREAFLNLSRGSYLFSKVGILFALSAIQTLLFALVGNAVLGVQGMYFDYWFMLFTVSCFANMTGLNISATFNSAVTIYILIPLLVIPQMILGGAMFTYDKLNDSIGGGVEVPTIAEFVTSRWAYEGLMVRQFKENPWEEAFYLIDKKESNFTYKMNYYLPELSKRVEFCLDKMYSRYDSIQTEVRQNLLVISNEVQNEISINPHVSFANPNMLRSTQPSEAILLSIKSYLDSLNVYYTKSFDTLYIKKEIILNKLQDTPDKLMKMNRIRNDYSNKSVSEIVKNVNTKNELVEQNNRLIQVIDPIYSIPTNNGIFNIKAHFYSPKKYFFNLSIDTYWFNATIIWFFSIVMYITLYYDIFAKILKRLENFQFSKNFDNS